MFYQLTWNQQFLVVLYQIGKGETSLELLGVILYKENDVSVLKEIAKSKKLLGAAKNHINLHPEH